MTVQCDLQWVGAVLGQPELATQDFAQTLKDGIVLCRLINKLQPGSVKKIKETVVGVSLNFNRLDFNLGTCLHANGKYASFPSCCPQVFKY